MDLFDQIIREAVGQHIFPGAVVLVRRGGAVLHYAAYGSTTYGQHNAQPVTLDTIYDIASLTKMFTATAALRLVERGDLALAAPVQRYLPRFRSPAVTLWHLLTHTSGLDIRLSTMREYSREAFFAAVYALEPSRAPGSVAAYTNVNSLLLGEVLTAVTGLPLEQVLQELLIEPLELRDTAFNPPAEWLPRIAPTEVDSEWRKRLVHGTVHDESAHTLGGVAGHAGLFSSASDIGAFCQFWLEAVQDGHPLLSANIARQAVTNQTAGLQLGCGLGWMLNRANVMGAAAAEAFGHTGFTGPAMLVIPSQAIILVLLSNRVYPQRGPMRHHAVTAALVGHLATGQT